MLVGEHRQRRVEADGVALAFEHGALEVDIEQHPGHAVEGLDVPAQEAVHAGVQEEAQEHWREWLSTICRARVPTR